MEFNSPCRHPHGHNARAEILLSGGEVDARGVLYDFGELKERTRKWVGETLSHRMLLRKDDPLVVPFRELGEPVVLFDSNPSAEAIAKKIYEWAEGLRLPVEEVRLWEDDSSWASYRRSA